MQLEPGRNGHCYAPASNAHADIPALADTCADADSHRDSHAIADADRHRDSHAIADAHTVADVNAGP
jgi:hypothetical protein